MVLAIDIQLTNRGEHLKYVGYFSLITLSTAFLWLCIYLSVSYIFVFSSV